MSTPVLAVLKWSHFIARAAGEYHLPLGLVASMVEQESSGDPCAWNPEPRYLYLWDVDRGRPFELQPGEALAKVPPARFPRLAGDRDQEWWAQQASWGLLQIMGATARELGDRTAYLTHLVHDPYAGLHYGCAYLSRLVARTGTLERAVSAYNAGSPQPFGSAQWNRYVRPIFARVDDYRAALSST